MKTGTKMALIASTLTVLSVGSTASFAENLSPIQAPMAKPQRPTPLRRSLAASPRRIGDTKALGGSIALRLSTDDPTWDRVP